MSQISPPIRILLVAVIGLVAVYMLFLRPKDAATVPAAPAAATTPVPAKDPNAKTQSAPGSAVQQAVKGGNSASARADAAAGGAIAETEGGAPAGVNTAPTTQAPLPGATAQAPAITADAIARLPKDVRGAVRDRKVLVLLFYNNRSYDDRAVRHELDQVDRYGKQVFIDAHWIKSVGRYQAITRGASVEQSPTVVVVDRNLKAETLVGYNDHETIDQLVVDALRASGGSLVKDPYFRQVDAVCVSAEQQITALAQPATASAVPAYLVGAHAIGKDADKKAGAIKAPKKRKAFHNQFLIYTEASASLLAFAAQEAKASPATAVKTARDVSAQGQQLDKRFVARNGAHGLSCF